MKAVRISLIIMTVAFISTGHSSKAASRKEHLRAELFDKDGIHETLEFDLVRRGARGEASRALAQAILKKFNLATQYGLTPDDIDAQYGSRSEEVLSNVPGYKFSFSRGLVDASGNQFIRPGASGATSRVPDSPVSAAALPAPAYAGTRGSTYTPPIRATPVTVAPVLTIASSSCNYTPNPSISMTSKNGGELIAQALYDQFETENQVEFYFKRTGAQGEVSRAIAEVVLNKFNLATQYGLTPDDIEASRGSRSEPVTSNVPGYKFSFTRGLVDASGKQFTRARASGVASRAPVSSSPTAAAPAPAYAAPRDNYSPYTPSPAGITSVGAASRSHTSTTPAPSRAAAVSESKKQIIQMVQKNGYEEKDIMELVALLLDLAHPK